MTLNNKKFLNFYIDMLSNNSGYKIYNFIQFIKANNDS